MWQSIDKLVGRGHSPADDAISATDFHPFFEKKVQTYAHLRMALPTRPTLILSVHFRASRQSLLMKLQLRC